MSETLKLWARQSVLAHKDHLLATRRARRRRLLNLLAAPLCLMAVYLLFRLGVGR